MSTVLWANHLLNNGKVVSDESDKWALYKYAKKLNKFALLAKVEPFYSLLDNTDIQFNMGDDELPDGMKSTNELMVHKGVWTSAKEALVILNGVLAVISSEKPRFGVIKNDYDTVVTELSDSIEYAKKASEVDAKFNFSIVM